MIERLHYPMPIQKPHNKSLMKVSFNSRKQVLGWVPNLRSLDMSAVTKADRANAVTWKKCNPQKKKKSRGSED